jgi:hypothetical protein
MGLVIEIKNIVSPNNFKLFYQNGRTPGSVSEQENPTWGTQYGSVFAGGTTSITIDFDIEVDPNPYGKQYWFKILDTVTNSYIIENIYIHELDFYTKCFTPTPTVTPTYTPICNFSGGSAISSLTPTPTITPTYTPNCQFSGGSALQTLATPTPTITATIVATPTPTITPPIDPILYYSFKQYPGANLTVTGLNGSELLNINSSAGSAVNGNITIPSSNCPYKVKVSWVSGSGNIVSYRLCDGSGGEITYVTGIDINSVYNEYTLSPTPYTAYINIASQNQTPMMCPE